MQSIPLGYGPIAIALCGLLVSCGWQGGQTKLDHRQTVQAGIKSLPWPRQMEKLFGEGDHFITYYGQRDLTQWTSVVYFAGRYELVLKVDVAIDYKNHKLLKNKTPAKFYLYEVEAVIKDNVGPGATFSNQWIINQDQWDKLVKANGDWSVLRIPVKTNSPVAGFDDYVRAARAPLQ